FHMFCGAGRIVRCGFRREKTTQTSYAHSTPTVKTLSLRRTLRASAGVESESGAEGVAQAGFAENHVQHAPLARGHRREGMRTSGGAYALDCRRRGLAHLAVA